MLLSAVRGPAPGYRDFGRAGVEGELRLVGNYGYSWSSAVSSPSAFFLEFSVAHVNSSFAHNRAHAFQVRCLQHLPAFCSVTGYWAGRNKAPAPGFRHSGSNGQNGGLMHVGYYGFSWSSSVSGSSGMYLDFAAPGLTPSNTGYRSYGFQVRCLQHLPAFCFVAGQ